MKVQMQESPTADKLAAGTWDVAFVGESVDQRGEEAICYCDQNSRMLKAVSYDPESYLISCGEDVEDVAVPLEFVRACREQNILLDATTLGFAELFLCIRSLIEVEVPQFTVLYVEPKDYSGARRTELMHRREFALSNEVHGYRAIPGAISLIDPRRRNRFVFFVGYEEQRLDSAFEDLSLPVQNCSIVFGVPAFQPGWEMHSFANNLRVMKERNMTGDVYYCGAQNPVGAMVVLDEIQRELEDEEKLFVAPIGTKPTGVGVALFAANNPNVGLLYDHPTRKRRRSSEVGSWHAYSVIV